MKSNQNKKTESRRKAEFRRARLRRNIESILRVKTLTKKDIKDQYDLVFPKSLVAGVDNNRLIVCADFEDRQETKSKYELDTWAFALYSCSHEKKINNIELYIHRVKEVGELYEQKWFFFLERRLAYMNRFRESMPKLKLYVIYSGQPMPEKQFLPSWKSILSEAHAGDIYLPEELGKRNSKQERNEEDMEQDRIMSKINERQLTVPCFKEFPICLKKYSHLKNKRPPRVDIIFAEGNQLNIIELKAGFNKELDVIAQILDYYIYFVKVKKYFNERKWEKLRDINIIKCFILDAKKHPKLKNTLRIYKSYGFKNVELLTKNEGGCYGDLVR